MVYILELQVSSQVNRSEWEEKLTWDEAVDRMDATFREKGREHQSDKWKEEAKRQREGDNLLAEASK